MTACLSDHTGIHGYFFLSTPMAFVRLIRLSGLSIFGTGVVAMFFSFLVVSSWDDLDWQPTYYSLAAQIYTALIGFANAFQTLVHTCAGLVVPMESRPLLGAVNHFFTRQRLSHDWIKPSSG
jgi:hypothetical protein